MRKNLVLTIFLFFISFNFFTLPKTVYSLSCEDNCDDKSGDEKLSCLNEVKSACEQKLEETTTRKKTLQSAINYIDSQIAYTQSQINKLAYEIEQLEEEINKLSGKITILNSSLEDITKLLVTRVTATYKHSKTNPILYLFSSDGFSDFISRFTYLKTVQANDRKVMFELEQARANYDAQKTIKEDKQQQVLWLRTEMIGQKQRLSDQQAAKKKILIETENDERKYQELLARARAEFEAIQNVLAGGGDETEVGDINEGDVIASIIQGTSCNSNGSHLHFSVKEGDSTKNPFEFLKSVDHENCSGSSCGSGDGDVFNPSGDWNWPIDTPVRFTQGYGETWAVRNTWVGDIYSFHNGIDISNDSRIIKAVKAGKLYRGSYVGSGGCTLRYVKVDHRDSGIETYYLHVNYL